MSLKIRTFKYVVLDGFGDPLKNFCLKESAVEFIHNKPDCKIMEIDFYEKHKHEEALF
jgi:hypothetical protein